MLLVKVIDVVVWFFVVTSGKDALYGGQRLM